MTDPATHIENLIRAIVRQELTNAFARAGGFESQTVEANVVVADPELRKHLRSVDDPEDAA